MVKIRSGQALLASDSIYAVHPDAEKPDERTTELEDQRLLCMTAYQSGGDIQ